MTSEWYLISAAPIRMTIQGIMPFSSTVKKIELTPAYDITPCRFRFDSYELALKVGKQGRLATFENALSNIGPFGLSDKEATSIVSEIKTVFSGWQNHFEKIGVKSKDIDKLSRRFGHCGIKSHD